jgi:hypothetical protein
MSDVDTPGNPSAAVEVDKVAAELVLGGWAVTAESGVACRSGLGRDDVEFPNQVPASRFLSE